MKIFRASILVLFIAVEGAYGFSVPTQCGDFVVYGRVRLNGENPEIVLLKGSQSEVRLRVSQKSMLRVAPYIDNSPVMAKINIQKPLAYRRGEVEVGDVSFRNPYGRSPAEITDGFELLKASKCL